jgi:hypothetical protein
VIQLEELQKNKLNQRTGSVSNFHVGKQFEVLAKSYLEKEFGAAFEENFLLSVGWGKKEKLHAFDLGNEDRKIIVECQSHKWTAPGDKVPSTKFAIWNRAMYLFLVSPESYKKIMFVLRDYSTRRDETLGQYYLRKYMHLIPDSVEVWEFDEASGAVEKIHT